MSSAPPTDDAARQAAAIFDPQRLRIARRAEKLSRAALASKVGVTPAAVGQWEAGRTRPRAPSVKQLSAALGFPVEYFRTTGRNPTNLDSDCSFFRSVNKTKQVDRDAAAAHATLLAEFVVVLERLVHLPRAAIPSIQADERASLQDVDDIAQEVRNAWGIRDEPIPHVIRELERHGATVARLALTDDVDAFSWPAYGRPVVILGTDKHNRIRSRFDGAHELGHLVMHRVHPRAADPTLERQAHRFASAFLIPTSRLADEWPGGKLDWRDLMQLKQRWQISLAALLYRARQDGLITDTAYESATRQLRRAGWNRMEPGDEGPSERPRLLRGAVEALASAGLTLEDVCGEARLPIRLVREYVDPTGPSRLKFEL